MDDAPAIVADYWMSQDGVVHAFNGPGGCVIEHEKPCRWAVPKVKVVERVVEKIVEKVVEVRDKSDTKALAEIVALAKTSLYAGTPMNPELVLAVAADRRS